MTLIQPKRFNGNKRSGGFIWERRGRFPCSLRLYALGLPLPEGQFRNAWLRAKYQKGIKNGARAIAKIAKNHARHRAKDRGLPFDLTTNYLSEIFPKDGCCPVLGMEFKRGAYGRDWSPSLDRIIPERGYVKGNVIWISMRANRIKTNGSPSEILKVATFFKALLNVHD